MEQLRPGFARVTEILSPFNDFSKVPPKILEVAKKRGTQVHDLCESYALGLLIEAIPLEIKGYIESFTRWFDYAVDEVISAEDRIYHDKYYFCGKYDLLLKLKHDSGLSLLDNKTPLLTSRTWQIQTAAYDLLLEDIRGIKVDRRLALKIHPCGKIATPIEYTNKEGDRKMFLELLGLHRFFNS